MNVYGFDHVQIAMPRGEEEQARAFYAGVLGMKEVPKPARLVPRGGVWLRGGNAYLHLGVEDDFRPARKAHPAFLVHDLKELEERCRAAGSPIVRDQPLEGYDSFYVSDPFGNRLEFMERMR